MDSEEMDGAIEVSSFHFPISVFLSAESLQALRWYRKSLEALSNQWPETCSTPETTDEQAVAIRQRQTDLFYKSEIYQQLLTRYPVDVAVDTVGGVACEVFTPQSGIPKKNRHQVLINLHGGAFEGGSRTNSHLESAPIAALGNIKVVSVDYRLAPDHKHPAAVDDAEAVYSELLKTYQPHRIGIFGSSSGGILTAQLVARLQQKKLPLPAAVAMLHGAAAPRSGDSMTIASAIVKAQSGFDPANYPLAYFDGVDMNDPMVFPTHSDELLKHFPPCFLATSTRDWLMSAVLHTHRQLTRLDVTAELHVWDGLDHVFHYNPALAETHELHQLTTRFFDKQLKSS